MFSQSTKIVQFLFLTAGVYACFLTSAIYHQKILKQSYGPSNNPQFFKQPLVFALIPQIFATTIGFLITSFEHKPIKIPFRKSLGVAILININVYTYNQAVIEASFPLVVMVKSCSLLPVILVAVFCSRVKDQSLKLGKDKIVIGFIASVGILIFNYFQPRTQSYSQKPFNYLSSFILLISLIGDGFLPDLQAQIKSEYKPSAYDMYYHINKCTFLVSLLILIITYRIQYIYTFMIKHPDFLIDISKLGFLNALGQIFIYNLLKIFKQHIPAFIIAVRKCFTVIINLLWFNHTIQYIQYIGILLVYIAVIGQVYTNRKKQIEHKIIQQKKAISDQRQMKPLNCSQQDLQHQIQQMLNQKNQKQEISKNQQIDFQEKMNQQIKYYKMNVKKHHGQLI